jgi:hypothetical protein
MAHRNPGPGTSLLLAGLFAIVLMVAACASAPEFQARQPLDDNFLRARATTKVEDGIRVSAAFPTLEEARSIFGIDFARRNIRPLWLEIENRSQQPFLFLPTGLDPEYFAPYEASFLYRDDYNPTTLGRHLAELGFDSRAAIQPGAASAGFVYVNSVEPSLLAQVDLFGWRWSKRISVIVPIPDTDLPRASLATLRTLYPPADLIEIRTEAELRTALEDLPCCVTNQNGAQKALPLNLVLIGDFEEIGPAFVSRGYSAAPAAPFYAFGRAQDMAVRKRSRWVAAQPQLLRVWLTPLRYERRPIWIAQVSSVQGGRFAAAAKEADRIDPAVDEARNDVVQDLFYSQAVARLGFLRGVERVAATEPRTTPDGSTYYTAGQRAVLLFADKPVSLSQIGSFNWETLQATGAGPVPLPR